MPIPPPDRVAKNRWTRTGGPFFIRLGNRGNRFGRRDIATPDTGGQPESAPIGTLRNVTIKDVTAVVSGSQHDRMGIMITGIPGHRIKDITFENVRVTFPGGGPIEAVGRKVPEDIARYPEQYFFGVLPSWGLYLRHIEGIRFKNVRIDCRENAPREPVVADDVLDYDPSGLSIHGVEAN